MDAFRLQFEIAVDQYYARQRSAAQRRPEKPRTPNYFLRYADVEVIGSDPEQELEQQIAAIERADDGRAAGGPHNSVCCYDENCSKLRGIFRRNERQGGRDIQIEENFIVESPAQKQFRLHQPAAIAVGDESQAEREIIEARTRSIYQPESKRRH